MVFIYSVIYGYYFDGLYPDNFKIDCVNFYIYICFYFYFYNYNYFFLYLYIYFSFPKNKFNIILNPLFIFFYYFSLFSCFYINLLSFYLIYLNIFFLYLFNFIYESFNSSKQTLYIWISFSSSFNFVFFIGHTNYI